MTRPGGAARATFQPGASRAVLFGVANYPSLGLNVPAAGRNIAELARQLRSDEVCGMSRASVDVVPDPTAEDVLEYVQAAARNVGNNGLLVIYFAGHAMRLSGGLALIPHTKALPDQDHVTVRRLAEQVRGSGARHVLLILDCCYAGRAGVDLEPVVMEAGAEAEGWQLFAASSGGRAIDAEDGETYTPFTTALIEVLAKGPVPDPLSHESWLTPAEVLTSVARILATDESLPKPATTPVAFERGWVRNPSYQPAATTPRRFAHSLRGEDEFPADDPWPSRREPFVGRVDELSRADRLLDGQEAQAVLPVVGPIASGKRTFVDQVIALRFPDEAAQNGHCLLKVVVANRSAPEPVLEQLADRLKVRLDSAESSVSGDAVDVLDEISRRLREYVGIRRLILCVHGSRLGMDNERIRDALERLFAHLAVAQVFVILTTRVRPAPFVGTPQLPTVMLTELAPAEVGELVQQTVIKREPALATYVQPGFTSPHSDPLLRFPGVVRAGAEAFVDEAWRVGVDQVTAENLATALMRGSVLVVRSVLHDAGCTDLLMVDETGRRAPGSLAALCAWAVTDGLRVTPSILTSISPGLTTSKITYLLRSRLLVSQTSDDVTMLELGEATRRALASHILPPAMPPDLLVPEEPSAPTIVDVSVDEFDEALSIAMQRMVPALLTSRDNVPANSDSDVLQGLRLAVGWLDDRPDGQCPALRSTLNTLLAAHSADLAISPIRQDAALVEAPSAGSDDGDDFSVVIAAASLVQSMRSIDMDVIAAAEFTRRATDVAAGIARASADELSARLVKSIDTALFHGGRRLRAPKGLLEARESAAEVLVRIVREAGSERSDLAVAVVSWLLNTAQLQTMSGSRDRARHTLDTTRGVLAELPDPASRREVFTRIQLTQRLHIGAAQAAESPAERAEWLVQAEGEITAALAMCEQDVDRSLWSRRLLDVVGTLVTELPTLVARGAAIDRTAAALTSSWGPLERWPEAVVGMMWNIRHLVLRGERDPAVRLAGAHAALDMAVRGNSSAPVRSAAHMFVALCLYRERAYGRAVQEGEIALSIAESITADSPGPAAFQRELRLLAQLGSWRSAAADQPRRDRTGARRARDQVLLGRIKEVQKWLRDQADHTVAGGRLDLWCITARWRSEGNLFDASAPDGEDPNRYPMAEKVENLKIKYNARRRVLDSHRRRYGKSVRLLAMEVGLERQYRRWLGVLERVEIDGVVQRRNVDNRPVLALLKTALEEWPAESGVRASAAEFHRYIWNYPASIDLYREVRSMSIDGSDRFKAALGFAEAVASFVQFGFPRPPDTAELIAEAREMLDIEYREGPLTEQAALLHARLALESDGSVDWESIETVGSQILEGGYAHGVSSWLNARSLGAEESFPTSLSTRINIRPDGQTPSWLQDHLRNEEKQNQTVAAIASQDELDPASILGDSLGENFTELTLLRGLGSLYLRRAELESDVAHARTAFDLFDGCRVVQEATRIGSMTVVSKFLIARCILLAAEISGTVDPFDRSPAGRPWLDVAVTYFNDCKINSVGAFGSQSSHFAGVATRLARELRSGSAGQPVPERFTPS